MTIAADILNRKMPDFDAYLRQGEDLNDIDEYGFTPLIESIITQQSEITKALIQRGVDVNKADIMGRTALHWAVENKHFKLSEYLLAHKANPNAYVAGGLSPLVYPILREQGNFKNLLFQYGAKVDFALDFINAKLIGHRFELQGEVEIINAEGQFIELDYEGFMLEFSLAAINDSLRRFSSSFTSKAYRPYFSQLYQIMDAFEGSAEILKIQEHQTLSPEDWLVFENFLKTPMQILPAASQGHAIGFLRYGDLWAKIDRGEHSLKAPSVTIYRIHNLAALNAAFVYEFLYKRQPRTFFHQDIDLILDLKPLMTVPMTSQITGNCSWANIQATVLIALLFLNGDSPSEQLLAEASYVYEAWLAWDQERAVDTVIQRFYLASAERKASLAAMLAAVLFQACDYEDPSHLGRAEKILKLLTEENYRYILNAYLQIYCVERLTERGNNLLKILDDCGIDPGIGVSTVATALKPRKKN